jgi:iron complex outermembrane receptor protein
MERSSAAIELGTIRSVAEAGGPAEAGVTATELPATVDVIGGDRIETENVDFAVGLMRKVPGVYFGDHNNGVVPGTFGIRGFDTNNPPPVTLAVDGIPHHFDPRGAADFQPFFAMEIEQMELVKGTNDPRFGVGNVAGTLSMKTKRGWDLTQMRLLAGEHNTIDAQMFTGKKGENFSQDYFVGLRSTDGHRENSDLIKGAVSGKWFYTTDDGRLSAGVIARSFNMKANAGGYTSIEEAKRDPSFSPAFSASDGGTQENDHISAHFDYALSANTDASLKIYNQTHHRVRWARFSLAGSQQERINDDENRGIIASLSHFNNSVPGFLNVRFDLGFNYDRFENVDQRYASDNRVRGNILRDWRYDWNGWGAYAQADGQVNDWLRLIAGIRTDSFSGDFTNVIAGRSSKMEDMKNIVQPKAGIVLTPHDKYTVYGNWGRTFRLPANPDLFGQDSAGNLIPSLREGENDGWEVGLTFTPIDPITVRLAYWELESGNELIHMDGTVVNGGTTARKGYDISVTADINEWFSAWAAYSNVDAKHVNPAPGLEDRAGQKLAIVPDYNAKIGLDINHPSGLTASLWMDIVDDYYPDTDTIADRARGEYGGYEIAHLALGYKMSPTITVGVDVRNLFDKQHISWIWDYDVGVMPGQMRSYYGWIRYEY